MFRNRIRLPFYLAKPQFPVERSVFRKADGSSKVLSAIVRNTYEGKTDQLPEDWHRKLVIALSHDEVTIEDSRFLSDVVLDGDYGIDWQDFLNYPLAQSTFTIQVTPFNATNSNCQSCAEIAQLDLVDDTTEDIFEEGETYDYPTSVLTNDNICCFPFTVEIATFNTLYFEDVSINQAGILTFKVKDSVPDIDDVLIATYRVTCENGGYDEANVYGNINGTSTACAEPTGLHIEYTDETTQTAIWDSVPGVLYNWFLYLASDIYTPILSGSGSTPTAELSGLTPGEDYVFAVQSDCGSGNLSEFVTESFTQSTEVAPCALFTVIYVTFTTSPPQSFSYIDCNGVVQNYIFTAAGSVNLCMLIAGDINTPVFFAATTPDITYHYSGPC
jgi:hypothetical protein